MNPQDGQAQSSRPAFTDRPDEPSLLDKIVSVSLTERRDEVILKRAELDYKQRLARMFASANCFADVDKDEKGEYYPESISIARAMIKIELGESMGFTAAEAMSGIDIIKGRPAIGAHLRATRMRKAGFSWPQLTCNDAGCWMPLEFKGEPMMQQPVDSNGKPIDGPQVQVVVSYTKADAEKAGLINKDNYKKNPSDMYFARCVTRGKRRYGPEVLSAEVLDTYEAHEAADPAPIAQIETERKTTALAEELKKKREASAASAKPATETKAPPTDTKPEPDPWGLRARDTFLKQLGEAEFLAVMHSVTGSEELSSIMVANHKQVWAAMDKALKKDGGVPVADTSQSKPKGDLF
jgi:hypothetical protein